jgi:alanine dehydrogenase
VSDGEMLYLSGADVAALELPMAEVVDAVETSFRYKGRGEAQLPPKLGIDAGGGAFAHAMPAAVIAAGALGVKWVSAYPGNPARGLPTISGLIVLSDVATGVPLAVMDAALVTALRTGASAGVAARSLARRDATVVGILGCGVQARTSLRALAEVLPELAEVRCRDVDDAALARFVAEMSPLVPGVRFVTCATPEGVADDADVVVTAIPMGLPGPPPLGEGLLKEGAVAVALDYDAAWSAAAMRACDVVVCDDVAQARSTQAAGAHLAEAPLASARDLGEICAGRVAGRDDARQRLMCLNLGLATHDVVTARRIYDLACERGVGTRLPL